MAVDATKLGTLRTIAFGSSTTAAAPDTTSVIPGANLDWSSETGWAQIAVYQGDQDIDCSFVKEVTELTSASLPHAVGEVVRKLGVSAFSFSVDELGSAALAYASNISTSSSINSPTTTTTYKPVAVELLGIGCLYFPKCAINISSGPGAGLGAGNAAKYAFEVKPYGTTALPSGWQFRQFTGAAT